MAVDRLQGLLSRFSVSARLFHSGPLCGITDFAENGQGQLHLVRRGPLEVHHAGETVPVTAPSLLFYPRPLAHRFVSDATVGADMACANLAFGGAVSASVSGGVPHPIARALPRCVGLPLAVLGEIGDAAQRSAVEEAGADREAAQQALQAVDGHFGRSIK